MIDQPIKQYATIGCCGIDCGLCSRYYIEGRSRCPGCGGPDFFQKHPSCGHLTCCVKKRHLEVCGECDEFPCSKFDNWLGKDAVDSFVSHRVVESNQYFIKKHGVEAFIDQQKQRMQLFKEMLNGFNDGRSRNFFCIAVTLLSIEDIKQSISQARNEVESQKVLKDDMKTKATILRKTITATADNKNIDLKLRKPKK